MPTEPKTILIVEDDELNMKLVKAVLALATYRVLSAPNAETGISLAQEQVPDLILMDIHLPGMDGIEATAIVKADEKLKPIPVIALSGYGPADIGDASGKSGFSGFITKPIEVRSFLETISGFLGERPRTLEP
jgi:two-component system cell cycle response regulator DivK